MRKLIFLLWFSLAVPSYGAIAYVNSVRCAYATSCATTWNVTAGNVLIVARWFTNGDGTLSDTQSNGYTQIRSVDTWNSNTRIHAATLASGGSTVTVNSTTTEDSLILAEFSGVSPTVDTSDSYNIGGAVPVCSPAGVSVTTSVAALVLSVVGGDEGNVSCTASTGTLLATGTCPNTTAGQLRYQIGPAATYMQQFTFAPDWNAGSANCGLVALRQTPGATKIQHKVVSQ